MFLETQNIPVIKWQARRESNPQHPVLETGALPIELLTYKELVNLIYKKDVLIYNLEQITNKITNEHQHLF